MMEMEVHVYPHEKLFQAHHADPRQTCCVLREVQRTLQPAFSHSHCDSEPQSVGSVTLPQLARQRPLGDSGVFAMKMQRSPSVGHVVIVLYLSQLGTHCHALVQLHTGLAS